MKNQTKNILAEKISEPEPKPTITEQRINKQETMREPTELLRLKAGSVLTIALQWGCLITGSV